MYRFGVFPPYSSSESGALFPRWIPRILVPLACIVGCGPAVKTQSLRLEAPSSLQQSPAESPALPRHPPAVAPHLGSEQAPFRFDSLSTDPPFVYRVIEPTSSEHPLFALTLQSCGNVTRQAALGNARILFTGMTKVQITPDREFTIGSERFPLQAADAQFEGEPVFLRVLSVPSPDCLTDFVVWSASNGRLTDRAFPVIEQLLVLHHRQNPPSTGEHPPTLDYERSSRAVP